MTSYRFSTVALVLVLVACQAHPLAPTHLAQTTGASTPPSVAPSGLATTAIAPAVLTGGLLRPPTALGATISGTLRVDASYVLATSSGIISDNGSALIGKVKASDLIGKVKGDDLIGKVKGDAIISDNGSAIISDGGSGLISDQGAGAVSLDASGGIISDNGSNLIVGDDSSLIGDQGLGLVSNNGSSLIGKVKSADLLSNNGGGLVSNNSGSLVSNNSGSLISNNSGSYHLDAVSAPAPGTELPAASMEIAVVSLTTGQPVQLGVDLKGHPAYAIYTDQAGHYTLYLPKGLVGNVRLVARPAGSVDPRMEYGQVLAPTDTKAGDMDEATALVAAYFRVVMVARINALITADPGTAGTSDDPNKYANFLAKIPKPFQAQGSAVLDDFRNLGLKLGLASLPDPARRAALLGLSDALCGYVDLTQLYSDNTLGADAKVPTPAGGPPLALPTMTSFFTQIAQRAETALARDPHAFDNRPYILATNRQRALDHQPLVHLLKPEDLGAYIVTEFLSSNDPIQVAKADEVLVDLGMSVTDRQQFQAASVGIYEALAYTLIATPDAQTAGKNALTAVVNATKKEPAAPASTPAPGDVNPVTPPPAETVTVSTLAGDGTAGWVDGPGASAEFSAPATLAFDPTATGTVFYVADVGNHRIRRVTVDATGNAIVSTIAGNGTSAHTDGVGTSASFVGIQGLVVGKDHMLYVADHDDQRIRKVDLTSPGFPVTTFAGTGAADFADGPAVQAAFNGPQALAFDAQGNLLVGEEHDARIRRIDMTTGAHPVSTFVGTGVAAFSDGPAAQAQVNDVSGFALKPDGTILFCETLGGRVRQIGPDGLVTLLAGGVKGSLADGLWADAGMFGPAGLWLDPKGALFVADAGNQRVREIVGLGDTSTLAGGGPGGLASGLQAGSFVDGAGASARFSGPTDVKGDAQGNLYVADRNNQRIRLVRRQ